MSKKELEKMQLLETEQKQQNEEKFKAMAKTFSDSESESFQKRKANSGVDFHPLSSDYNSGELKHSGTALTLQDWNELRRYKLGISPTRKRRMMLQRTDLIRNVNSRLAWDYFDQEEEEKRRIPFHEGIHIDPKTAAMNPRTASYCASPAALQKTESKIDEENFEREIAEKIIATQHSQHKAIAIRPSSKYGADLRLSNSLEDYSFPVLSTNSSIAAQGASAKGTPLYTPATFRTPVIDTTVGNNNVSNRQMFDDEEDSPTNMEHGRISDGILKDKKFSLELRLLNQKHPTRADGDSGNFDENDGTMASDSFRDERREQFMADGLLSVSRDVIEAEETTILTKQIVDSSKKISSQAIPLPTLRKTPKKYTKFVEELDHRPRTTANTTATSMSNLQKQVLSKPLHYSQQQDNNSDNVRANTAPAMTGQSHDKDDSIAMKRRNSLRYLASINNATRPSNDIQDNNIISSPNNGSSSPSTRLQCSDCYCQAVLWCTQCMLAYCILCWNRVPHHTLYNMVPAFPNELVKQYQRDQKRIDKQYNHDLQQEKGSGGTVRISADASPEKNKSYGAKVMFASLRHARAQQYALKEELVESPPTQPKLENIPIDRNLLPAPIPLVDNPRRSYSDYPMPGVFLTGRGQVLDVDESVGDSNASHSQLSAQRKTRSMQQQRQQKEKLKEFMYLDQEQRQHYQRQKRPVSPSSPQPSPMMPRPVSSASISRKGLEGSQYLTVENGIYYMLPDQVAAMIAPDDVAAGGGEQQKPPRSAPALLYHQSQQKPPRDIVVRPTSRVGRSNLRHKGDDRAKSPAFNLGGAASGRSSSAAVNIAAQGRPSSSAQALTGIAHDLVNWRKGSFKQDLAAAATSSARRGSSSPIVFQDDLTKSGKSTQMERQELSPKAAEIKIFSGVPVFTKNYKPRSGSHKRKETVTSTAAPVTSS